MRAPLWGWVLLGCGCLDPGAPGNLVARTVDDNPDLSSYTLSDGARIHLREYGDPAAPALILLHGGPGGDHRSMQTLTALSERYHVIAWDQRGAGLSSRRDVGGVRFLDYVEDLEELVDRFSPDRGATLVGHSFGAAYATAFTNAHPMRVRQLVLLDPTALNSAYAPTSNTVPFQRTEISEALTFENLASIDDEELRDFQVLAILLSSADVSDPPLLWRPGATAGFGVSDSLRDSTFNFTSRMRAEFPTPILILVPEDECCGPPRALLPLQLISLRSYEVQVIPGTRHQTLPRAPETVAAIRAYLEEFAP